MLNFPAMNMPANFVNLLKVNMQTTKETYQNLSGIFHSDQGLWALIERGLKELDPDLKVDYLLKSLGWHGFRDRLCSMYVYYGKKRNYPRHCDLSLVSDIIDFEEKLKEFTVQGHSRAYALGFYYRLLLDRYGKNSQSFGGIFVDDELIGLLKYSKTKVVKIDFLLILLLHLRAYLGAEKLKYLLKEEQKFQSIYGLLGGKEKEELCGNLLRYSASIYDSSLFTMSA